MELNQKNLLFQLLGWEGNMGSFVLDKNNTYLFIVWAVKD